MATTTGILGRKIGMTQVYDAKGIRVGVTVIEAGPCAVLQVKTPETDGYHALQLGFGARKESRTPLSVKGHCKKAGAECKSFIREIALAAAPNEKVGDQVTVQIFEGVKEVDVLGISKGKGFQGVMKRWNFRGLGASHGTSKRHRAPGALGRHMSISKGVPKGKRMAGHLGTEKVTIHSLSLVKIDPENHLLLVKGAVPGANGSFLLVRRALSEKVRADKVAKKKAG